MSGRRVRIRRAPSAPGAGSVAATARVILGAAAALVLSTLLVDLLVDVAPEPAVHVIADFEGASGPLDGDGGSLRWVAPGWQREDGAARAGSGTAAAPSMAITMLPAPPTVIGATVVDAVGGTALVFRYQDPDNYWQLAPVARFGTWEVRSVVGGRSTRRSLSKLSSTGPRTRVEVHVGAGAAHVFIDGRQVAAVPSGVPEQGAGVGFVGVTGAAWDRLIIDGS